ncbi:MFS general substrate transporter [Macroventuria anomochaeta]|uniref:MFS general substrate transporter n=1 Tax=Macroventuria anomochaeta TaxID=301207 RepID=A0ACB6RTX7_9PLEO|nr:MFS general substrate transporter [Macroventuria anomochaeta]KAF2624503.1 MFS general substrate transporter [Macroventuria anomochaeta]
MAPNIIKNFRSFRWDSNTHLKSHERVLLRKLDFSILTLGCLGFFLKYLDQGNLSNAYVSGMQEDLRMYGNKYTYAVTCYTVAYAVMQIPTSSLRCCVPGSWYTKTELAKRITIFHMTTLTGRAFGGYLQAAVHKSLDGHHGLEGWRWLYICMTVPTLYTTCAWFLTDKSKQIVIECVKKAGKAAPAKITLATFKHVLTGWRWYAFVLGNVLYGSACGVSDYFGIWLKSEGFSIVDRNIILSRFRLPTVISGFCIVLWGFSYDYTGSKFAFVFGPLAYRLISNGILAFWPPSQNAKLFAFLTMKGFQYAVATWLPIVIFPQTMAPTFRYGFPGTFGLVIAALIVIVTIQLLQNRSLKKEKKG